MPDAAIAAPYFLQPGELVFSDEPMRVKTVLGSCLAIAARAPRLGLACLAHCLLPTAGTSSVELPRGEAFRYVDATLEFMFETFARRGAHPGEMEIKLFGAAATSPSGFPVGRRNVEVALEVLARYGVVPARTCVGGRRGLSIEFHTDTGEVFVKRLPCMGVSAGVPE